MSDESMVKADGSIKVLVPRDDVTWFDFLYFSRATNSKFGGWNTATDWSSRGLQVLSGEGFPKILKEWTQSSCAADGGYLPAIRMTGFKLDREGEFLPNRGHLLTDKGLEIAKTRGLNGAIDSTRETLREHQLSARLYVRFGLPRNASPGAVTMPSVRLLSYEVPLVGASAGQLRVDLLGVDAAGVLTLVELKQEAGTDSPLMALVELICYATQISRFEKKNGFWNELRGRYPKGVKGRELRLAIVAPGEYWTSWRRWGFDEERMAEMRTLVSTVGTALNWSLQLSAYKLNKPDDESQIAIEEFFPDEGR